MSPVLRIILFLASVCFLVLVLVLIHKRHLSTNYSLLWIVFGVLGTLSALVPTWVFALTDLLGFELPVNFVFFFCIFFLIVFSFCLTSIVSSQSASIHNLVQDVSLLKGRIESLERVREAPDTPITDTPVADAPVADTPITDAPVEK